MENFAPVSATPNAAALSALRERREVLRSRLFEELTAAYPQAAMLFPAGSTQVPPLLLDACSFLLRRTQATEAAGAEIPEDVLEPLRAWALDLRRTGFPAQEFPAVAQMLSDALHTDTDVLGRAASAMQDASEAADLAGVPAASAARVTDIQQDGDVTIFRAESGARIDYAPGQALPAMLLRQRHDGTIEGQGQWYGLASAMPANEYGQLEFHTTGEFDAQVDDYITVGAARGPVVAVDRPKLFVVAVGTGLAAAKALIFDLLEQSVRPQLHVVLAPTEAVGLYDLAAFQTLGSTQDWLEITCICPAERVAEYPALRAVNVPTLAFVAAPGLWWEHGIVLCGTDAQVHELAVALQRAGAPADALTALAHDRGFVFPKH